MARLTRPSPASSQISSNNTPSTPPSHSLQKPNQLLLRHRGWPPTGSFGGVGIFDVFGSSGMLDHSLHLPNQLRRTQCSSPSPGGGVGWGAEECVGCGPLGAEVMGEDGTDTVDVTAVDVVLSLQPHQRPGV